MKDFLFQLTLFFFLEMKTEQAISGTSAATHKVMEPQCIGSRENQAKSSKTDLCIEKKRWSINY